MRTLRLYRFSHQNVRNHPSFQERSGNFSALYNIQESKLTQMTLWCSCLGPARTAQGYELQRLGKRSVNLSHHCAIANSSSECRFPVRMERCRNAQCIILYLQLRVK